MEVIRFRKEDPEYGFLSNFSPHGLALDGLWWPTSEHFYQAQKFVGTSDYEVVFSAATPSEARRLGRFFPIRRPDWEDVKVAVMKRALLAKFMSSKELGDKLLATGDAHLVEWAPWDRYWGDGGDGSGENVLGRLLMELRAYLRLASPASDAHSGA